MSCMFGIGKGLDLVLVRCVGGLEVIASWHWWRWIRVRVRVRGFRF